MLGAAPPVNCERSLPCSLALSMTDSRIGIPGSKEPQEVRPEGYEACLPIDLKTVPDHGKRSKVEESQIDPQEACVPEIDFQNIIQNEFQRAVEQKKDGQNICPPFSFSGNVHDDPHGHRYCDEHNDGAEDPLHASKSACA